MTDEMLSLARENQEKAGARNVEFLKGAIENIPLPENSVDVIISNCVINLSGDKDRVLREAFRVLKTGRAAPISRQRRHRHLRPPRPRHGLYRHAPLLALSFAEGSSQLCQISRNMRSNFS